MNEDSIIDAYQLRDITVSPDVLLLDPKNPRIVLKVDKKVDYTLQELASPEVQDYILSVVDKAEFHVADLIKSIGQTGFLDHGNRMILERVDGTGKYLVLEGNRRLTAIKHLLNNPSVLSERVLESLRSIRAHELVLTDVDTHNREEIIFKLLGMLHLKGQLEWGAMERAYYIYKAYMFELEKYWEFEEPFYNASCSLTCGETFNMKPQEIKYELATFLVYLQLQEQGYAVIEEHYTLINMAVRTQGINRDYFGLDWYTLQFSFDGLERFSDLCLEEERPVHNPGDFKKVVKVYKNGTTREMGLIGTGEYSLDEIIEVVENRQIRHQFVHELEKIEKQISSLRLMAPAGLNREAQLVMKIRDIANQILRTL